MKYQYIGSLFTILFLVNGCTSIPVSETESTSQIKKTQYIEDAQMHQISIVSDSDTVTLISKADTEKFNLRIVKKKNEDQAMISLETKDEDVNYTCSATVKLSNQSLEKLQTYFINEDGSYRETTEQEKAVLGKLEGCPIPFDKVEESEFTDYYNRYEKYLDENDG